MNSPTKRTVYDWFLEILALSGLVAAFIPVILSGRIAAGKQIPKHFNFAGEIDAWGGTGVLWFLALLALGFYAGMLILEGYPQLFNYPVKITENNRTEMQKLAIRLIRHIRMLSVVMLGYLNIEIFAIATDHAEGLHGWIMALLFVAMAVVMIIYIRAMFRQEKK